MPDASIPESPGPGYHWVFPHHFAALDLNRFLESIKVLEDFSGADMRRQNTQDRLALDKALSSSLTANVRKDTQSSNVFRDYQQVYSHLGILYPLELVDRRLYLTPLGAALASGTVTLPQFLALQALGYQVPNGASNREVIERYRAGNVLLKPGLYIWQLLTTLASINVTQAYVTLDEIAILVVPQRDHGLVAEVANTILELRAPTFGHPSLQSHTRPSQLVGESGQAFAFRVEGWQERRRATSDFLKFLGMAPGFAYMKSQGHAPERILISIPTLEEAGREDLLTLVDIEIEPSTFISFLDGNADTRLTWFNYFGGSARIVRWSERRPGHGLPDGQPHPISLRPYDPSIEGIRISVSPGQPRRTPEQTATLQEERRTAHERIIRYMATRVLEVGGTTFYDPRSVDLAADLWGERTFVEAKTFAKDLSDVREQVREGIGQLLDYRYRTGDNSIKLCMAFDCRPATDMDLIPLLHLFGIQPCWWDEEQEMFVAPPGENPPPVFLS